MDDEPSVADDDVRAEPKRLRRLAERAPDFDCALLAAGVDRPLAAAADEEDLDAPAGPALRAEETSRDDARVVEDDQRSRRKQVRERGGSRVLDAASARQ